MFIIVPKLSRVKKWGSHTVGCANPEVWQEWPRSAIGMASCPMTGNCRAGFLPAGLCFKVEEKTLKHEALEGCTKEHKDSLDYSSSIFVLSWWSSNFIVLSHHS